MLWQLAAGLTQAAATARAHHQASASTLPKGTSRQTSIVSGRAGVLRLCGVAGRCVRTQARSTPGRAFRWVGPRSLWFF